jgi:hypothetical protein
MPILSTMDAATTSAIAGEANLSKNQLWTINWYLTQSCQSRLMVPEQRLDLLAGVDRMVSAKHGTYLNWKKSQPGNAKLESVKYWACSIPNLISREATLMLELQIRDRVDVTNGLKSYETISGEGWGVVAGVNHGKGAWQSYIKFFTEDTKWHHEQADKAKKQRSSYQIQHGSYCIKQSAHKECRKDTTELLNATVTKDLNEGYSSLLCSKLIAMSDGKKYR